MEMKKYKLGEIATVEISGVDKKAKENEKPIKLCNFTDVYHNWAITRDMEISFMDATATDKEIDTFVLKKGQVAFTKDSETRDDIGIPTYIADDFDNVILGYHTALITPDKTKLSGKYLNAFMNSNFIKKYFENNASGSGQRYTLSNDTLNSIPIILPEISIQEKIGEFFSNIDRKIALNKKINAKLEAMAKRLYDYWFVQFDFPNEEGKPYKSSGGKMVWNEVLKRKIPEGWEVKSIFEASDVLYGYPYATEPFDEDNLKLSKKPYKVVRIRDIQNNSFSAKTTEVVDEKYKTKQNDLLVGMDGYFHMNFWFSNNDYINQRIVRFRKTLISTLILNFQIKPFIKFKETMAKGSTVGHLSDKDLKQLFIAIPNDNSISDRFDSILNMITKNNSEIQKLTDLRDRLLPLLMNGQVEVK